MEAPDLAFPSPVDVANKADVPTLGKIFGLALLLWWVVPLGGGFGGVGFMWDLFSVATFPVLWQLLAGIGLCALGFLPPDTLKPGVQWAAASGIGLIGLLSISVSLPAAQFPVLGLLGVFSIATLSVGLFLWSARGFDEVARIVVLAAGGLTALYLLVPVQGTMPIVGIFKILGSGGNFFGNLLAFIILIAHPAIVVASVVLVALPGEAASESWVRILAWASLAYLPLSLFIMLFVSIFFAAGAVLFVAHIAGALLAYLVVLVLPGTRLLAALREGTLSQQF